MNTKSAARKVAPTADDEYQEGYLRVPIEKVFADPSNERRTMRNLDDLAKSVETVGVIEPITVTQNGNNYMILTGHRRYHAAQKAGLVEIDVIVRTIENNQERRRKSLISNLHRDDLTVMEKVDAIDALFENGEGYSSQRDLAEALGKSESWVSDILTIKRLATPLQEKLRSTEVLVPWDAVARIAREKNAERQAKFIDRLIAGASTGTIRRSLSGGQRLRKISYTKELDGYIAWVSGPKSPNEREKMLAVLNCLMDLIRSQARSTTDDASGSEAHDAA